MKKITLIIGLVAFSTIVRSQNGLEKIIVEKYYISNADDAAGSEGALPIGSVTYRVYADMLPGYNFRALYGNSNHPLKISTTTTFFNNEDRGVTTANAIDSKYLKSNTVALDSWLSVGASAIGQFGVLKSEDNGAANLVQANTILKNNVADMDIPLTVQDGNMAGTPEAVTLVGLTTELNVFDATSQVGGSFFTKDGAISALTITGAVGPTSENRILIGQFTTDGVFSFELNLQIGKTDSDIIQYFVASNPTGNEISIPTLIFPSNALGNSAPSITLTAPTTAVKNDVVALSATASDADGTITRVEFFVDNVSIGVDLSSPYTANWTAVAGDHIFKATATDNSSVTTTSSTINITVTEASTGINELNGTEKNVSVYPNPLTSELNITIKNAKVSNYNFYKIHDYKGVLVLENELGQIGNDYTETVNVSTLPSGVYFLTVSLAGEKTIKKINIQ
jgi:hypothetical protein